MKRLIILLTAGAAMSLANTQTTPATKPRAARPAGVGSTEWPTYGHDSGGMRFSPLTQITPENAGQLKVAWVYHMKPAGVIAPAPPPPVGGDNPEPAGGGGRRGGGGRFSANGFSKTYEAKK